MITKWTVSSMLVILIRLGIILLLHNLTLVCWIVLEIFTWSMFFLFFIEYSKVLTNHLFLFFIIQTSCRFIWILSSVTMKMEGWDSLTACFVIGLSLIVKIGLFPGHSWGLYIYNTGSIPVVLALSSIIKIAPLIMLIIWFAEHSNGVSQLAFFFWICISYVIVMVNIRVSRNLFSFIFFSGIFHIRNIILILTINFYPFFFMYYLTYFLILISFVIMYYHHNIFNLQRDSKFRSNSALIMHLLRVAGFPPFPLFWYKLFILYKLWRDNLFLRNETFVIIAVIFLYFLTLFIFFIKGWSCSKNYSANWLGRYEEAVGITDWYSLLPHLIFIFLPRVTLLILL